MKQTFASESPGQWICSRYITARYPSDMGCWAGHVWSWSQNCGRTLCRTAVVRVTVPSSFISTNLEARGPWLIPSTGILLTDCIALSSAVQHF